MGGLVWTRFLGDIFGFSGVDFFTSMKQTYPPPPPASPVHSKSAVEELSDITNNLSELLESVSVYRKLAQLQLRWISADPQSPDLGDPKE